MVPDTPINPQTIQTIFTQIDKDKDDQVDEDELRIWLTSTDAPPAPWVTTLKQTMADLPDDVIRAVFVTTPAPHVGTAAPSLSPSAGGDITAGVVGGVIGGAILLCCIAGALVVYRRRRRTMVVEVQCTKGPVGGSFTLSASNETTPPIPFDATAEQMRAALGALPAFEAVRVRRTAHGGEGCYRWTVTSWKQSNAPSEVVSDYFSMTGTNVLVRVIYDGKESDGDVSEEFMNPMMTKREMFGKKRMKSMSVKEWAKQRKDKKKDKKKPRTSTKLVPCTSIEDPMPKHLAHRHVPTHRKNYRRNHRNEVIKRKSLTSDSHWHMAKDPKTGDTYCPSFVRQTFVENIESVAFHSFRPG